MGIYDRDYYRNSPSRGGFGHFVAMSVTTWLIAINVVVFFADAVLHPPEPPPSISTDSDSYERVPARGFAEEPGLLAQLGSFSIDKAIRHGQAWRFISYQFLHDGPWHLIMNMLGLYFFGPIVEGHFGSRRYLAFYLLCGLAGAVFFSIMAVLHVLWVAPSDQLIGASGSIFGLLVASAIIAPDVQLFYYLIPITVRTAAIIAMGLAIYTVMHSGRSGGDNAGGQAAHFGGGALGFLFMKNQHWLHLFEPARSSNRFARTPAGRQKRARAFQKDWSKDMNR